jgi:hypothetical protein
MKHVPGPGEYNYSFLVERPSTTQGNFSMKETFPKEKREIKCYEKDYESLLGNKLGPGPAGYDV